MGNKVNENSFSIYKGRRVLVTGDTGFKGSWLSLWLHELGANVVGFALPPQRDLDHFNLLGLGKVIHHVNGDIRNFSELQKIFADFQPEFLFHLAAQPLVRFSYKEPKLTFDTNVGGSVNILETARTTASLRVIIYVTSDKCYKNKEWTKGYTEEDELGGHDPYSASKASAELVFLAYLNSIFKYREHFGAASVRAGNVIGGGDWSPDRILPDCIKTLQKEGLIILRNPSSTRPWQHVLEPLFGYLLLGAELHNNPKTFSGSWNFGPSTESNHTVKDLAEKVLKYWGSGKIKYNNPNKDTLHETSLLQLNCDKALKLLGWEQKWDFDRTVSETVFWYKEVLSGKSAMLITKGQVKKYLGDYHD